mmetsp:Transcript_20403/g.36541  ORF Transcript_20403/g.36541 Transcript_20403/m.36541 type:complete len:229 (-) Transcript_20403:151-837(-)|eukprot:CAMPEP_0197652300 /NCGR_PEP_ID=MMETSP1338-20131121/34366_1 /TAXON_ID=43686 ORGANISM="Pelagodinium beii, Strain RCC1491" /NCGR_SAMPLE_ID=MMETSP1338 /ASSEMBLY_ACC=CAM_ASM_000754 /LENGTH=228 /DNA_ID=CAMNT_0043227145 /DNA_START=59 /DNA_END=745 /DNA_ORIENTATION=+
MGILDGVKEAFSRSAIWTCFVLTVHLGLCITEIIVAPGNKPLLIAGTVVSKATQWANTSFCLLSVFCIIQALVGTIYYVEGSLKLYNYLLAVSALVDIFFMVEFIAYGLNSVGISVALGFSIAFKLAGLYVLSKFSRSVRNQNNAELLPHLKHALSQSFNDELEGPAESRPIVSGSSAMPVRTASRMSGTSPGTQTFQAATMPAARTQALNQLDTSMTASQRLVKVVQ